MADASGPAPLRVLVVEDEPVALEAHAAYVVRVPGFQVAATAATTADALRSLQAVPVDVVLLDMNPPDRHGLDVVRAMRAAGRRADVIAVTSARDLEVVRAAVSLGVVQYLLKPFVFATLRERLEGYRASASSWAAPWSSRRRRRSTRSSPVPAPVPRSACPRG